jgi:hypothetical protein
LLNGKEYEAGVSPRTPANTAFERSRSERGNRNIGSLEMQVTVASNLVPSAPRAANLLGGWVKPPR